MGTIIKNGIEYSGGSSVELDATLSIEGKAADAKAVGDTKISYTDVVDNLESTATDLPLSANMGRKLKEKIDNMLWMSDGASKEVTQYKGKPVYEISWKATFEDQTEGYKVITNNFNCTNIELVAVNGSVKHNSGSSATIGSRLNDTYYSYVYLAADSLRLYHSADMASYILTIRYQFV